MGESLQFSALKLATVDELCETIQFLFCLLSVLLCALIGAWQSRWFITSIMQIAGLGLISSISDGFVAQESEKGNTFARILLML